MTTEIFCAKLVVSHLVKEFGPCDITRTPSRKERKIIESFVLILRDAMHDNLTVDFEEENCVEEDHIDPVWSPENDDDVASRLARNESYIAFGDVEVPIEKVEEAIAFYRSSAKKTRTFSCMKNRFRFITTEYHMRKLRELAKESEVRANRCTRLRSLAEKLKEEVLTKLSNGISLHDNDIRRIALKINKEGSLVENFKASRNWINGFKTSCGIVSRRVTKFTSRQGFLDKSRISAEAQSFVLAVKEEMKNWSLETICNADQSGFAKELHSARTLAIRGQKKVERVVQSSSAMTHSFTVMPILFADGHLAEKLYMVLQEPNGRFPAKGCFRAPNLEIRASTSHMMTKQLMLDWVKCCIGSTDSPSSRLLIVDSWTSFKDHAAIQSAMPAGKTVKVLNIPPGATSQIQPLDVYFFLPFKAMFKRIISYVTIHDLEFRISARDSIIRLVSLVYFLFRAPRFKNFLSYSWHAAGYLDAHPGEFETPVQCCFSSELEGMCHSDGCSEFFFIRCSHCEKLFCFTHFVLDYHICSLSASVSDASQ